MSKKLNYDQAFAELNYILQKIQSEDVGLEELSTTLKRANELAEFCRIRLRNIEEDIQKIHPDQPIEF
ncbi:MAG: exodeoxyribonuclease VII small subunit [Saprospiraceae bacterium]|jgi:exodeoxyribonuclease VII small subunit|nr:exodeoxyribonuclease VII small subunit [Saprospiraceae bacterium]